MGLTGLSVTCEVPKIIKKLLVHFCSRIEGWCSLQISSPLAAANSICSQGGLAFCRRFSVLETENVSSQSDREGRN